MTDQRNLILAIVLSIAIMLGFQWVFDFGAPEQPLPADGPTSQIPVPSATPGAPSAPGAQVPGAPPVSAANTRQAVLAADTRIRINTPSLHGSIALKGARIDDLTLVDYHETPDPTSPEITLLSPLGAPRPYFAEFGWVAAGQGVKVPSPDTQWTSDSQALTPATPVTLTWDNGEGLRFIRTYALDDKFMFKVSQRVENYGAQQVTLHPYSLVSRIGRPATEGFYILHEGPIGVVDGTLKEYSYDDLADDGTIKKDTTGGWVGITDKYWLTSVIPDQDEPVTTRFNYFRTETAEKFQVDYLGPPRLILPSTTADYDSLFFAGAKKVSLIDDYAQQYGIEKFDLAIDFGWFYFLTKPFFYILQYFHGVLGNFGLAILAITVLVKLIFFPLANKSYKAMSRMKVLAPEMKKLQERYSDDKPRLQQEIMGLYKREKVNPVSGCLPILVQIPVFFALYKVLFVALEMRHAPFYGWINDLSAPDPTSIFNLFGLLPFDPPSFLMIGIWPLIMGGTMFLQQKLNPQPTDPMQAKLFMILPVVFTFLLATFPAGLVIYWAWSNSLSILQQWVIMRKMGVKA